MKYIDRKTIKNIKLNIKKTIFLFIYKLQNNFNILDKV